MQFSNYDFIDSKSFAGKIILTSFPGLNPSGLFEETILANELEIFKNNNCSSITSFVEDSEFENLCDKTLFVKNIYEHKLPGPTIAAALLHDVGHLIYEDGDPIHEGKDGHHENLGADFLKKYFGEDVILPIRALSLIHISEPTRPR